MSPQKGFAPIVIIIAFLIFGGLAGAFYWRTTVNKTPKQPSAVQIPSSTVQPTAPTFSPTPLPFQPTSIPTLDSTANWKTYTNPTKTISFQYHDWKEDNLPRTSNALWRYFESPDGLYKLSYSELLNYNPNAITDNHQEYKTLKEFVHVFYQGESWVNNTQMTTLGRQEAIKTPIIISPGNTSAMEQSIYTFSKDKGYIYGLTMTVNTTTDQEKISTGFKLFDQILASFSFTE